MIPLDEVQGQYHSYLVRVWQDELKSIRAEASPWQGEVIHIQTGRSWLIQDIEPLLILLNSLTNQDQT